MAQQRSKRTSAAPPLQPPAFATPLSCLFLLLLLLTHPAHSQTNTSPIKNVVILVMENRSFDHMLGWMKRLNPSINGVTGTESNPANASDPSSPRTYFRDGAVYVDPDPGHSFQAIREQVFGDPNGSGTATMSGFVQQANGMDPSGNMSDCVMQGFQPDSVAVYRELVSQFAVFDRWFASMPASTQPNRLYVHSATSLGAIGNDRSRLAAGFPQRTIFDVLHDADLGFNIYYQNIPAVLFYRNLRKLKYISRFHEYDPTFFDHAKNGRLPAYSVIEQRYLDLKDKPATDDHPSHDVYRGQMFIKEVYEALRSGPQWNQTLLAITYDEHGGFYDHVPTPTAGVPSPDGVVGPAPEYFQFDRLGVRVPTIMVSPWIEKGTVVHGPNGSPFSTSEYEHSSIPATVKKFFNLPGPYLTKRDQWAGTFEAIVQKRTEPRTDCPMQLPTPLRIRQTEADESKTLSEFQRELLQLASVLTGDHELRDFDDKVISKMTVVEADDYVHRAVHGFLQAGRYAKRLGAEDDQVVQMRPSLTTRSTEDHHS